MNTSVNLSIACLLKRNCVAEERQLKFLLLASIALYTLLKDSVAVWSLVHHLVKIAVTVLLGLLFHPVWIRILF